MKRVHPVSLKGTNMNSPRREVLSTKAAGGTKGLFSGSLTGTNMEKRKGNVKGEKKELPLLNRLPIEGQSNNKLRRLLRCKDKDKAKSIGNMRLAMGNLVFKTLYK